MAIAAERPDIGVQQPHVEVTREESLVERSRRLLVAHGLLSSTQILTPLPEDSDWRRHKDSDATYLVEQEIGTNVVYVSSLPSHAKTTRHTHHDRRYEHVVFESYVCVEGQAVITLNDREERVISAGQKFQVWPGVRHQVRTNGVSAVLAIVLENGARYPRDQRHIIG